MSQDETTEFSEPTTPKGMLRISSNSSVQSMDNERFSFQTAIREAHLADPTHNYSKVWKSGFYIKIAQLVLSILCIACYSSGVEVVTHDFTATSFPFVIHFTFLIINAVIILCYLMRQKMPEIMIRTFGFLGGILLTVVAITSFYFHAMFQNPELQWSRTMLLTQAILSLLNAILYYTDGCISYYKSLNGLFI